MQEIDWKKEIDAFLESGMTIKGYTSGKPYSTDRFKQRLYKDPRYQKKAHRKRTDITAETVTIIPVIVERKETAVVEGLEIDLSKTGEEELMRILSALRRMK